MDHFPCCGPSRQGPCSTTNRHPASAIPVVESVGPSETHYKFRIFCHLDATELSRHYLRETNGKHAHSTETGA